MPGSALRNHIFVGLDGFWWHQCRACHSLAKALDLQPTRFVPPLLQGRLLFIRRKSQVNHFMQQNVNGLRNESSFELMPTTGSGKCTMAVPRTSPRPLPGIWQTKTPSLSTAIRQTL